MKKDTISRLRRQMIIHTVLIVIGAVCAYEFLDYMINTYVPGRKIVPYDPIDGIGMILPMALIVGFLYRKSLQNYNKYYSKLIDGINKVSDGDFSFTLDTDTKNAGPLADVFEKFNIMIKELQGVETLKEDFVNQFSHEFKTPISSINGFVKMLQNDNLPEDKKKQYFEIIQNETKRLSQLSASILSLSKLESQQLVSEKSKFSLDEQIKECIILLSTDWNFKNIDMSANLDSVVYNGDKELTKQLWINLLSNAIKFTPENGSVSLTLKRDGSNIFVTIKDSGCGISQENINRIFNKYFKTDSNAQNPGIGLGLSIVKQILQICNGSIIVESELNKGSTFIISLPI